MFGHDDHHQDQDTSNNDANVATVEPTPDGSLVHDAQPGAPAAPTTVAPSADTDAGNYLTDDAPAATPASDTPATEPMVDAPAPAPSTDTPVAAPAATADDLLNIKQQALQQLSPLVGHLEQTPEERFRTTMMMIQAADNDALIKDAYAAAQEITDEKVRAQALLDIVNEINYFTQHNANADAPQQ